jgi:hypothetical protein
LNDDSVYNSKMTTWTKSDAACEQLDAAIGLLADRKLIAAHALVGAAAELATDVARATGNRDARASLRESDQEKCSSSATRGPRGTEETTELRETRKQGP